MSMVSLSWRRHQRRGLKIFDCVTSFSFSLARSFSVSLDGCAFSSWMPSIQPYVLALAFCGSLSINIASVVSEAEHSSDTWIAMLLTVGLSAVTCAIHGLSRPAHFSLCPLTTSTDAIRTTSYS